MMKTMEEHADAMVAAMRQCGADLAATRAQFARLRDAASAALPHLTGAERAALFDALSEPGPTLAESRSVDGSGHVDLGAPDQCGVVGDPLDMSAPVCALPPGHAGPHCKRVVRLEPIDIVEKEPGRG